MHLPKDTAKHYVTSISTSYTNQPITNELMIANRYRLMQETCSLGKHLSLKVVISSDIEFLAKEHISSGLCVGRWSFKDENGLTALKASLEVNNEKIYNGQNKAERMKS